MSTTADRLFISQVRLVGVGFSALIWEIITALTGASMVVVGSIAFVTVGVGIALFVTSIYAYCEAIDRQQYLDDLHQADFPPELEAEES